MLTYFAHCLDCGEHFETRSGTCPGCREGSLVRDEESCEERGCRECRELRVELEKLDLRSGVRPTTLKLVQGGKQ